MKRLIYSIFLALMVISSITVMIARCAKEYSCEGERCGYHKDTFLIPPLGPITRWPPRDTTDTIPADTAFNDLVGYHDFYIVDNSQIKGIYENWQTKYIPGHFQIIREIPIQTTPDGYYTGFTNLKDYKLGSGIQNLGRIFYDSCFQKGDRFSYFFEIRYKNGTYLRSDTIILVY